MFEGPNCQLRSRTAAELLKEQPQPGALRLLWTASSTKLFSNFSTSLQQFVANIKAQKGEGEGGQSKASLFSQLQIDSHVFMGEQCFSYGLEQFLHNSSVLTLRNVSLVRKIFQ